MTTTIDQIRFGELIANLPAMIATESPLSALPPSGAGKLLRIDGSQFKWEPIPEAAWLAMPPEKRASVVIERGFVWLEHNGDITASPIAFVDPSAIDNSAENIFGGAISTLKEAICAAYRLLHSNPANGELAVLALSFSILTVLGLLPPSVEATGLAAKFVHDLPAAGPHIAQAFVVNFGQRFCGHKS